VRAVLTLVQQAPDTVQMGFKNNTAPILRIAAEVKSTGGEAPVLP
jgi:hypothetical protein